MDILQTGVITLIKSALTGEKLELSQDFELEGAVLVACKHQITSIIYYGAINCGLSQDLPIMQQLFLGTCSNMATSERQMRALDDIFSAFDKNKIDYMPLKGTLLKKMYPKKEMRNMGDADILIRTEQYDDIKSVMLELGYEENAESDHELVWYKKRLRIELHKRLIPSYNKDYYAYFGDGWQLGKACSEGSARYAMSPEDEMIYLFTHYAKHYRDAGIGIKHILDLWVYHQNVQNLDQQYIYRELEKLQLLEFYKNTMKTLEVWFGNAQSDEVTDFITHVIFNSGVFGTHEAKVLSKALKDSRKQGSVTKTRNKNLFEQIFLPYRKMCIRYSVLEKWPILLPVMWVVRWVDALFFRTKTLKRKSADIKSTSNENVLNYEKALHFVGLDFNFKE